MGLFFAVFRCKSKILLSENSNLALMEQVIDVYTDRTINTPASVCSGCREHTDPPWPWSGVTSVATRRVVTGSYENITDMSWTHWSYFETLFRDQAQIVLFARQEWHFDIESSFHRCKGGFFFNLRLWTLLVMISLYYFSQS